MGKPRELAADTGLIVGLGAPAEQELCWPGDRLAAFCQFLHAASKCLHRGVAQTDPRPAVGLFRALTDRVLSAGAGAEAEKQVLVRFGGGRGLPSCSCNMNCQVEGQDATQLP